MDIVDQIARRQLRTDIPPFRAGDTVRVHVKVKEGNKERVQLFEGVVIARRGSGMSETFTVRKVSYGVGVERVFPLHARTIEKIEVKQRGQVRRAKLYYLRERSGRSARIQEKKIGEIRPNTAEEESDVTPEESPENLAAVAASAS